MLTNARMVANLRVPDLVAAVDFYEAKLGLPLAGRISLMPGHEEVLFQAGGSLVCVEPGEGGGTHTPIAFQVDDVDGALAGLRERGVEPEEYDLPHLKTVNGVLSMGDVRAAWIKDPGGNLIGLMTNVLADEPAATT